MDKNRTEGTAKHGKGGVKEAVSKTTGHEGSEAKAAAEKAAGKIPGEVGKAKDAPHHVGKK